MAAVISSVMNTKDKVPFFVNRCEEMGIEVLPPDVNSSDHSFVVSENAIRFGLDAVKNVGHSAVEAILRAREDDADRLDLGLLRAGRLARGQQTRDRMPDQVRRPRLDRRDPQRDAGDAAGGAVGGPEGAGGRADGPGLDLRLRRRGRGRGWRRRRPTTGRRSPPPSSTAPSCWRWRRRRSAPTSPRTRWPKCGAALRARVDCSLAAARRQARRLLGDGRRHRRRVQEDPHQERQPDDVRHPRRRRGPGRDAGLQGRRVGERRR